MKTTRALDLEDSDMNWKIGPLVCLLALSVLMFASPAAASDVTLDVQQDVLQNFLTTVGTVGLGGSAGTTVQIPYPGVCWWGPFPYPCIQWASCNVGYSWSVSISNVGAQIVPGSIPFNGNGHAQASAGVCGLSVSASYSPAINGHLSAIWQGGPQEIWFALQSLNVEIYVSILGFHITFGYIDVSSYLPNPLYKQAVPLSQSFTLPAPISKQISAHAQNVSLALLSGFLQLTADLSFSSP
jgi:hypothetical protein